ncbi:MAG: energy transducer TonB [Myxococcota bacterium]
MFKDFQRKPQRFAIVLFLASLFVAMSIFGGVVYAFYRHHLHLQDLAAQQEEALPEEETVMVEFTPPPEDEPEPEPEPEPIAEPVAVFRPAAARPVIRPPDEIPDEQLEESDAPLVDERPTGPVGGDTRGRPGGMGTAQVTMEAPPPPPPPPPTMMRERRNPRVSTENVRVGRARFGCSETQEMQRLGISGVVLVSVQVDERGNLRRFDVIRGHDVLKDRVRECLRENWQRFDPAKRADGTPVAWTWRIPFRFRPRNL